MSTPTYQVGRYLQVTPTDVFMTFGEHSGCLIQDVPDDYLRWALRTLDNAPEEFHTLIRAELHRRKHEGCIAFSFGDDE